MPLVRDIVYALALLIASPLWIFRLLGTGKWRTDWRSRFGHGTLLTPTDQPTLLIHAVSVGEVNAIRQLVQKLEERTDWRIVISVTTDTGTARARELFAAKHAVVRFPLDFSWMVRRLLDRVTPDLVALTELEVWPNFVAACDRRRIPVCVVNGRLSARSFGRYKLVKPLLAATFGRLVRVAAQNAQYAEHFIGVGVSRERVEVLDTMKWDTAQVADRVEGADALAAAMGIDRSKPVIVAGSTGPGEDELLIQTCPPDAQLVIVPRKPEWFESVARLAPDVVRRTKHPDGSPRPPDVARLFLLDTIGELRKAYALADVVIVGRSFLGLYGSDMMEPIALGKPTIIGPYHGDFADIMAALTATDGIVVTSEPGRVAAELLADREGARGLAERGRRVILSRQGATDRHAEMLVALMNAGRATRVSPP